MHFLIILKEWHGMCIPELQKMSCRLSKRACLTGSGIQHFGRRQAFNTPEYGGVNDPPFFFFSGARSSRRCNLPIRIFFFPSHCASIPFFPE
jgi:hypothetical protein